MKAMNRVVSSQRSAKRLEPFGQRSTVQAYVLDANFLVLIVHQVNEKVSTTGTRVPVLVCYPSVQLAANLKLVMVGSEFSVYQFGRWQQ